VNAAADLFPENIIRGSIEGIPLYNADQEVSEGIPESVEALKDKIATSDGLLLATPEYNNSMPGVFKNAIDWLSRPPEDLPRVFHNKPVAIIGASPGGFGTMLAQSSWLPVLRTLKTRPWFGGRLLVSRAHTLLDAEGTLVDEAMLRRIREFVSNFIGFCDDGH
jgi:NAD(P)H-dependent FMN reductase